MNIETMVVESQDARNHAIPCLVRKLLPGSPKTRAMMPRKVLDVAESCGWSHWIAFDQPPDLSFRVHKKRQFLSDPNSAQCEKFHILVHLLIFLNHNFIDLLCRRGLFEPLWRNLTINSKIFLEIQVYFQGNHSRSLYQERKKSFPCISAEIFTQSERS